MVSVKILAPLLFSAAGWPVCVTELLLLILCIESTGFWRFLGLYAYCSWFSVPKNYLDFVFINRNLVIVFCH